jgi:hypothetical protein
VWEEKFFGLLHRVYSFSFEVRFLAVVNSIVMSEHRGENIRVTNISFVEQFLMLYHVYISLCPQVFGDFS